ncbi:hypothetical protein [Candidatus Rhabdochlamydia porcellionis]|jgi:hypothetical protein|uniref:Lipoprotein n=1 Tax=Candidatus Rhabdochlamydia porcellionis TaxID=225148 RepID=A0ABX8Z041_9BACT|nr:hypothetical protein [Candidatus Rhabdochlamydia porcellionis]QZA59035.1 hypothetical protein RHAB15C_0000919 [Candidatus Rhabdochlamydia porcellionis]
MKKLFIIFFVLLGCNPSSYEDFQFEGNAHCRKMLNTLKSIQDRQQLLQAQPILKQHFEDLVDLMIAARKFQQRSLESKEFYPSFYSIALKEELKRLYEIEGGREIIERTQKQAFLRLGMVERQIAKKQVKVR